MWKEQNKSRDSSSERGEASTVTSQTTVTAALVASDALLGFAEVTPETWVLDTGCSFHMTGRRDWLLNFRETSSGKVKMGNDTYSDVKGMGDVKLLNEDGTTVLLTQVRYVPEMSKNLISLGTLEDKGCWFESRNGVMKIIKGGDTVLTGRKLNTLYFLQATSLVGEVHATDGMNDETSLWHSRLGHIGSKGLEVLVRKGYLDKVKAKEMQFCEDCVYGKTHRVSFGSGKHVTKSKMDYVHSDLWGAPTVPLSIGKCQYFITFIDDFIRKTWIYFIKTKDEAFSKFVEWKALVENQTGRKLKTLRTDNGLEFCNREFDSFCKEEGVVRHRTCSYSPQQNGVAERMNRTIMNKVRCMLSESGMGKQFWAEAASTAVYVINKSPSSSIDFAIPDEMWTGHPPDYKVLRRFGSVTYVHADQGKLNPRAKKGIFVGYPTGIKGFRVWLLDDKKCVVSRDVVFQEGIMYKNIASKGANEKRKSDEDRNLVQIELGGLSNGGRNQEEIASDAEQKSTATEDHPDDQSSSSESEDYELENYQLARDRARRTIKVPLRFTEEVNLVGFALNTTEDGETAEPTSYQEAMDSADWKEWKEATEEEMSSLSRNHTWELEERPEKKHVIGSKWIFKRKAGIPGVEPPRYKARLVAKGYSQKEGVDYQEIFSPVVKQVSIRYLLSIVVQFEMELEQMDVKTAFLHGELDEHILMEQPEGYEVEGRQVCCLKKSLYGLKQSPRKWNQRFNSFMCSVGYQRSRYDTCVYIKKLSEDTHIYLLLYVDDMLIASSDKEEIKKLKKLLSKEFEMKDLGPAKKILGMDIIRNREEGTLWLSQENYVDKVLSTYKMDDCKSVSTPLGAHFKLRAATDEVLKKEEEYMKQIPYANVIGSVMYLMIGSRPDLAYAVGLVCRYMSNPTKDHWQAVKWVLRYIRGSKMVGLQFKKSDKFEIKGYCDSDYATDPDRRRSVSGYVFTSGGNTISWKSGLQSVVALSTTEAEYIALNEAAKEAIWLKGLSEEMGFKQSSVQIMCDSQSAIALAKNSVYHERTKHIDVKFHFIREKIEEGRIQVDKISTIWNPADILTKSVPVSKLQDALKLLRVSSH